MHNELYSYLPRQHTELVLRPRESIISNRNSIYQTENDEMISEETENNFDELFVALKDRDDYQKSRVTLMKQKRETLIQQKVKPKIII